MSGQIIGPIGVLPTGGGGGGTLTFTATDVAQAWTIGGASPFTFSCNIGTASSDRIVVVCVALDESASTVTAVTAGATNTSLTPIVSYAAVNGQQQAIYASAPGTVSGSGAQNVVISTSNPFPAATNCMVGTITGSATATAGLNANVAPSAVSNDPHSISIASVPTNGVAVIYTEIDGGGGALTLTWTGTSSSGGDSTVRAVGGNADIAGLAHGTNNSVSFNCGVTGRLVGILMAAWGP